MMSAQSNAEFVLWMGPLLDALRELGDSAAPQEASDRLQRIAIYLMINEKNS
jgi:restriction system protein